MKIVVILIFAFLLQGCIATVKELPHYESESGKIQAASVKELPHLNVKFMLRGYCYAGSAPNQNDLGGFASSQNMPQDLPSYYNASDKIVELVAFPSEKSIFKEKIEGFKLVLANNQDTPVKFPASDSRLSIIMQAKIDNKWRNIEYLPSSWCGHSYHTVTLPSKKAWVFSVPVYAGSEEVTLRFYFGKYVSNEFSGRINLEQLTKKQGHKPTSIMDPYNE